MKYKNNFNFLSIDNSFEFDFVVDNEEGMNIFLDAMLPAFLDKKKLKENVVQINIIQQKTKELELEIRQIVESLKSHFPRINQLNTFLKNLKDGEHFCFLFNVKLDYKLYIELNSILLSKRDGGNVEEIKKDLLDLFGDIMENYKVFVYGNRRFFAGEMDKMKRVCRFCKMNNQETTFKKTSHAISEGLGNKLVFTRDECDICNDNFSISIEPDIINYLSIFRTIFSIKGKGGLKKITGKGFKMKMKDEGVVNIKFDDIKYRPPENKSTYEIKLENISKISYQNIYKCLCKYALSLIPNEHLKNFNNTISWINGDLKSDKLPKVAEVISNKDFTDQPKLKVYLRKNSNKENPYAVGEFYFAVKVIVFIIPLFNDETEKFLIEENYNNYWNFFKSFKSISSHWQFNDFSSADKLDLSFNLLGKTKEENHN